MEKVGGYILIVLTVFFIALSVFMFILFKQQNDQIIALNQTCEELKQQVNSSNNDVDTENLKKEIQILIKEELVNNNSELLEASYSEIDEKINNAIQTEQEELYKKIYQQVITDLSNSDLFKSLLEATNNTTTEEPKEEEKKEEKVEEKKEEEKKEETKPKTTTQSKPKTSTPAVTQEVPVQQPVVQPSTPITPSKPANDEDSHFESSEAEIQK